MTPDLERIRQRVRDRQELTWEDVDALLAYIDYQEDVIEHEFNRH